MSVETQLATLTTATAALLEAVNVNKAALDDAVMAANAAEAEATEQAGVSTTKAAEAVAAAKNALNLAKDALNSANTAAAQAAAAAAVATANLETALPVSAYIKDVHRTPSNAHRAAVRQCFTMISATPA